MMENSSLQISKNTNTFLSFWRSLECPIASLPSTHFQMSQTLCTQFGIDQVAGDNRICALFCLGMYQLYLWPKHYLTIVSPIVYCLSCRVRTRFWLPTFHSHFLHFSAGAILSLHYESVYKRCGSVAVPVVYGRHSRKVTSSRLPWLFVVIWRSVLQHT